MRANFSAVALHSVLSLGALLAVAAGVIMLKLSLDDTLKRNAAKPQALFEIRLPPGTTLPANRRDISVEMHDSTNVATAYLHDVWRSDGDRPVISGGVALAVRTTRRLLVLKITGEPDRLFTLKLAGKPGHADAFGPWQPIDSIDHGGAQIRQATTVEQYDIRYRPRDPNVEFARPILEFECTLPASTPLPDDFKAIVV